MTFRIGQGFAMYAFDDGLQGKDKIILGGVAIPYNRGLKARSDGDVLLQALSSALLGALALGDVKDHFPDADPNFKNVETRALLRMAYAKVRAKGYSLLNADITIITPAPGMASSYIGMMRQYISDDLGASFDRVSVKTANSGELEFSLRNEGIATQAVVLLQQTQVSDVGGE